MLGVVLLVTTERIPRLTAQLTWGKAVGTPHTFLCHVRARSRGYTAGTMLSVSTMLSRVRAGSPEMLGAGSPFGVTSVLRRCRAGHAQADWTLISHKQWASRTLCSVLTTRVAAVFHHDIPYSEIQAAHGCLERTSGQTAWSLRVCESAWTYNGVFQ